MLFLTFFVTGIVFSNVFRYNDITNNNIKFINCYIIIQQLTFISLKNLYLFYS